ncbi:hypothetical protein [Nocardia sp. NPDC020380]|uniref:hypothetical protein n=1 Tax=Nocardia sp. NPDC020380 TaxID=3364309 RepID=UPI0037AECF8F
MVLTLVLLLLIVIAAVVAAVMVVSSKQKQSVSAANEVVPGTPTRAPASWAGSHDPEPRLHRRLRDAMTTLRTANALDDGTTIVLRAELEQAALAWDDRLVAIAALPAPHRERQREAAAQAVQSIEDGVAQYVSASTTSATAELQAGLSSVRTQLDIQAQIRKSLEAN